MTPPDTNATSQTAGASGRQPGSAFADSLEAFIRDDVVADDEVISSDTDLLLTGLVDSLGVVMIVEWIEEQLGVTIDPADVVLEHFQTIDAMLGFLQAT